jgi:predicted lysophospholipase L1 biosynthesis ABC-type transport system permease subunit
MLQKANLIAELYGYATEYALSSHYSLLLQNILPLDEKRKQQWPKAGDEAAVVLQMLHVQQKPFPECLKYKP